MVCLRGSERERAREREGEGRNESGGREQQTLRHWRGTEEREAPTPPSKARRALRFRRGFGRETQRSPYPGLAYVIFPTSDRRTSPRSWRLSGCGWRAGRNEWRRSLGWNCAACCSAKRPRFVRARERERDRPLENTTLHSAYLSFIAAAGGIGGLLLPLCLA